MKFCNAGVEDRSSDLLYLPYLREQKDKCGIVAKIHVKYSRDSQLTKLTHYKIEYLGEKVNLNNVNPRCLNTSYLRTPYID